jgi:hypothetical protein
VETQLREKPLRGSQTQKIHYLEDKACYKAVALTYPYAMNTNTSQPSHLLEGVFNGFIYLRAPP